MNEVSLAQYHKTTSIPTIDTNTPIEMSINSQALSLEQARAIRVLIDSAIYLGNETPRQCVRSLERVHAFK